MIRAQTPVGTGVRAVCGAQRVVRLNSKNKRGLSQLYLTHKNLNDYWILDIETDDLKATVIHCIVLINAFSRERVIFRPDGISGLHAWLEAHPEAILVGHNIVSFDAPVINTLTLCHIANSRLVDTLVLSYLYHPNMPKGHSLEAWGERLKYPKGDFHDFSRFSEEMLTYCINDCELTLRLFLALTKRMREKGFSEKSCEIEHNIRVVINKQERNGFYFEIEDAKVLHADLLQKQLDLEGPIRALFPPEFLPTCSYKYRLKKDGTPVASYLRHCQEYDEVRLNADGSYDCYELVHFNIGSPQQRVQKLLSLGWKPNKFTKKTEKGGGGNPQVDEESLIEFANKTKRPEIKAIADWLVLQGRSSMVQTWLNNVNYEDHRMHGRVFTCGAATRRMTHSSPNMANPPKARASVPYGIACRGLFTVGDKANRCLVGYDAKGLEMRTFAHYLNNPEASELFITGDPHLNNTRNLGLPDEQRDTFGKAAFFAFLFGAMDPKLGSTIKPELSGKAAKEYGKFARGVLVQGTPGLAKLVRDIQREYEHNNGWLETIDGGFIRCPSPHAALNYKCQSAGAIVMKVTSIILDKYITEKGLDALRVADIHDEGQIDTAREHAEQVGLLAVQSIREAGEALNLNLPFDGSYHIGDSWATTH